MVFPLVVHHDSKYSLIFWSDEVVFSKTLQTASESLGKQQRQELRNRLSILIGHLLKWEYQSQQRSHSWLATLRIQRLDILELLEDNPSLKPYLEEALQKAYIKGVALVIAETNLSERTFPHDCPYSLAEVLGDRFYPGKPSELN
jgi:Domain of unknown function DUF29